MLRNNKLITYFILGLIFILAVFLRFYNLGSYPVGFHQDEASLGYNGYSLMLTGKDDNGNKLPLYIDMFGDNRPSGYHYLTILPIKLFGLNEFATRFPGALFGSMIVLAIFFLVVSVFKDRKLGLISALLTAIAPWSFVLSRASAEAMIALFFIITGFGLFFYSLEKQKIRYLLVGVLLMTISFLFYHTPRVFVPGIFLFFTLMFFSIINKSRRTYKIAVFLSLMLMSIFAVFLVFGISGGTGRYSQVNIFSSFETNFLQKQQVQEDAIAGSGNVESRFFHNKLTNISLIFVNNYFDYFGFNFLFTKGGLPIWYSIPRVGLLYLLEFPFILIGLYCLIKEKNIYSKIPLVWLLISPVIPSITMDDVPNVNRVAMMFPMLEIIAGFGFLSFIKNIKNKKQICTLIIFFLMLNFLYFLHQYFYNAKTNKPWYRNNGFPEMMQIVNENYSKYDRITMSKFQGGIYPLVLFYSKYNPEIYQKEGSPKNKDYEGFGKFFFVPQDCPSAQRNDKTLKAGHTLYIDKGDCLLDSALRGKKIEYVDREDGTKAFRIVYD
ncbi:MAG: glycosyltransferase family 39 protein [Candidatus Parcubacteria bacterium]|nr:glycosyltransferase family 39 protein [Candidatus Parcubacteria bacterium]